MKKSTITILLLVAIILVVNFLSNEFYFRIDTTKDKTYTLSKATNDILKNLDTPITVSSYFTEDLPPQYSKTLSDFKDLLKEYNRRSGGMINFEFIDPNLDEVTKQEAAQSGIQPLLINVRERDEVIQKQAFMGAIIKGGEQQEILPFIQPEGPMEYQLTTAVKKVAVAEKPVIGMTTGHGELSSQELIEVYQELSVLYDIEPVDLKNPDPIPSRIKTVVMARPQDSISGAAFAKLDNYLSQGGQLCMAINAVNGDFQTVQGTKAITGVPEWLMSKGILLNSNFILDAQSGSVGVQQKQGLFSFQSQVQFHYFPAVSKFQDHPITSGIEKITFPFASSITNTGTLNMTPLVSSSNNSLVQDPPIYFDIQKKWTRAEFKDGPQTIGALFEGDLSGTGTESKLILFSDADFAISQGRNARSNSDNFSLLVNSIDWLSDDTGLIDLRTKGVSSRPIEDMEDGKKNMIKWTNFLLPLFMVLILGIYRNQRNRNKRMKRMSEKYELRD